MSSRFEPVEFVDKEVFAAGMEVAAAEAAGYQWI
jgi:hypothetical protein